jgi:hypothetical protein
MHNPKKTALLTAGERLAKRLYFQLLPGIKEFVEGFAWAYASTNSIARWQLPAIRNWQLTLSFGLYPIAKGCRTV